MKQEPLPLNHPSNRLGELIFKREGVGEVRWHKLGFFAWDAEGYMVALSPSKIEAHKAIGMHHRVGYDDDGFGNNKLGRCIEKHADGEIWKVADHAFSYYVWMNGNEEAHECFSLKSAREMLGIVPMPTTETLPKAHYAQNRKGYRADSQRGK